MSTPIILDCDPGHDDAFAILLAAGSDDIDLRAVTVVAGNQTVEKSAVNARHIVGLARLQGVPVAAGHAGPLLGAVAQLRIGDLFSGPDVHGETGMDGWDFGEPVVPEDGRHAVELIIDVLTASAEPVTIVATGPQTNVAAVLMAAPRLKQKIREIVCMGGSTLRGNFLPYSEANVLFDPEAAAIVLASGVPVAYCGLNATHQALVTPEVLDEIRPIPRLGEISDALLGFRSGAYDRIWGMRHAPLHDPVAVAMVIDPALVRCQDANIAVELHGAYTRGATAIDLAGVTDRPPNARVALEVDTPRFWKLLTTALRALA